MKTIKFLTTVLALAIVAVASAVEKPKMDIVPLSEDRAVVSILNGGEALFELSIRAKDGELVYYKESASPALTYQKIFDFKNIEDGDYSMDLRVNDTRLVRDINISSKGIVVGESKMRIDPYFGFANNVLKLTYLNFDNEKLSLNIYDESGLVYASKLGQDFNVATGFDLSALDAGRYEVILTSGNNDFLFSLEK
ncbi:hypothetical protein SAMN05444285_12246 [Draconibacterium orientale]|uniref:Por secretion system C-terminal sorting domain-containing protein n=1 Tax=Draconibacterium orientale TaxID=1168034 RepID=X5E5I8_9BACT|nr:hypothetical protein [Draconibacterium orientale]AHW61886.1 hypothetical protein FH5T_10365 [Draconibacterium orientale]SET75948.1 hypothetical protein SAMN05444285_12246 [Draconibacterium orientale]